MTRLQDVLTWVAYLLAVGVTLCNPTVTAGLLFNSANFIMLSYIGARYRER